MRTLKLLVCGLATLLPALALCQGSAAPSAQISGNGKTLTHTCASHEELTLNGGSNEVTVSGLCNSLTVTGSGNRVSIESVNQIKVTGDSNTISWSASMRNKEPKVQLTGAGNTVRSFTVNIN